MLEQLKQMGQQAQKKGDPYLAQEALKGVAILAALELMYEMPSFDPGH